MRATAATAATVATAAAAAAAAAATATAAAFDRDFGVDLEIYKNMNTAAQRSTIKGIDLFN